MLDCHCHLLDFPELSGDFFSSLAACNINKFYCNTVSARQWSDLSSIALSYPQIIPFYGLHPWHLDKYSFADLDPLGHLLDGKFSCCGEIGLDRLCKTDFTLQEKLFRRQLDIAFTTKSFVAIHCVKAWGRLFEILAEYQGQLPFMVHSFQGSLEVMERLVALGGMISFSHRVMAGNQQKILNVLKATPLENLLLESDFPFSASDQGDDLPTYCQVVTKLYAFVCHHRQLAIDELAHMIEKNGSICTY